jgi:putative membrane protein
VILPYCGSAPLPGELLTRFNLDPVLIASLLAAMAVHAGVAHNFAKEGSISKERPIWNQRLFCAALGWFITAAALLSPLCALSVALFAARVAQHMILALVAAPLIALGLPARAPRAAWPLVGSTSCFFLSLWFWHMPLPYDATFHSTAIYWCMHLSLFGSAIWFWFSLIHHARANLVGAFAAGILTSIQMGMLGAFLSLGDHPLFRWHLTTTQVWHLSPLEDQQLGGVLMWVPGIAIFLWAAIHGLARLWSAMDGARAV